MTQIGPVVVAASGAKLVRLVAPKVGGCVLPASSLRLRDARSGPASGRSSCTREDCRACLGTRSPPNSQLEPDAVANRHDLAGAAHLSPKRSWVRARAPSVREWTRREATSCWKSEALWPSAIPGEWMEHAPTSLTVRLRDDCSWNARWTPRKRPVAVPSRPRRRLTPPEGGAKRGFRGPGSSSPGMWSSSGSSSCS